MSNWVPSATLILTLGYSKPVPGKMFTKNPNIGWIRKQEKGRGYELDVESPLYQQWAKKYLDKRKSKSETSKNIDHDNITEKSNDDSKEEKPMSPLDLAYLEKIQKLKKESDEALLRLPIKDLEKKDLDIQSKNLDYMKKAKDSISTELVEFSYFGYISKLNMMIINAPKRIKQDLSNEIYREVIRSVTIEEIEDEDLRESVKKILSAIDVDLMSKNLINFLIRLQESMVIDIKKQQREDLLALEKSEK